MDNLASALGAVLAALGDVVTRLRGLTLLCFALVLALAFAAAWAAGAYLPGVIPDGEGAWRLAARTAEIVLSLGAGVLVLLLSPIIAMIVSAFLFDLGAEKIERVIGSPKARFVPVQEALMNGARIAGPAFVLNILALFSLFIPPLFPFVFLGVNGFLFGREFFTQAAVRHMRYDEARALRARAPLAVFVVGLACSLVPFIAPLLAASAMPRLLQALTRSVPVRSAPPPAAPHRP